MENISWKALRHHSHTLFQSASLLGTSLHHNLYQRIAGNYHRYMLTVRHHFSEVWLAFQDPRE